MKYLLILLLLSMNVEAIEQDKKLHLGASSIISSVLYTATEDPLESYLKCLAVGGIKEGIDELRYGGASIDDMKYNALGCGLGLVFTETIINPIIGRDVFGIEIRGNF